MKSPPPPKSAAKPAAKPAVKPPSSHHHGQLRQALITAGIELLDEGGLSALTLRACAARAGVSHAAPAHHFKGIKGLLTAIVAQGYQTFTKTMIKDRSSTVDEPRARLIGICEGYLRFARENDALFVLMFSPQKLDFEEPELARNAQAAYEVLAEACAPFCHGGGTSQATEIMIWSLVHGFALLSRRHRTGDANKMPHPLRFEDILPHLELRSTSP